MHKKFPFWADPDLFRALRIRKIRLHEAEQELERARIAVSDIEAEITRRQAKPPTAEAAE